MSVRFVGLVMEKTRFPVVMEKVENLKKIKEVFQIREFWGKRQGKSDLKLYKQLFLDTVLLKIIPMLRKNVNCH